MLTKTAALFPVPELLDADRRGADPAARHDQGLAWQPVRVNKRHRAEVVDCLQGLQHAAVRIAATASSQHGTAARHGAECVGVKESFHSQVGWETNAALVMNIIA